MMTTSYEHRQSHRQLTRSALAQLQLEKLNRLLAKVLPTNRFYAEKLGQTELPLRSLSDLQQLPYTFKEELVCDIPTWSLAANLTYPIEQYVRYHQTSGTHGRPIMVLDTAEDWQWWIDTWQFVLDAAELGPEDRTLLAFSFGPFIGFWSAFDAVQSRGSLAIPSGGMSSVQRLELLRTTRATTMFCTPSYALHLAEIAGENQIDPASLEMRRIIVAGEPGGSVPAIRQRIEKLWNARVVDHAGASEVGPWGFADSQDTGLHVIESEFIAEFLSLKTGAAADDGELAELVITPLGRLGSPVIRYRTGDVVRPTWKSTDHNHFVLLSGGILGRVDDMFITRGVNLFPSSIEQILRSFPEVVEYRLLVTKQGSMDMLTVEVEDRLQEPLRIAKELHVRLGLQIEVKCVPLGSLPRFQGKGQRFVDNR